MPPFISRKEISYAPFGTLQATPTQPELRSLNQISMLKMDMDTEINLC
jgi:hypothetical protein